LGSALGGKIFGAPGGQMVRNQILEVEVGGRGLSTRDDYILTYQGTSKDS